MKIGIITFNSAHNYGAVLQAWAMQEYLKSLGHEVQVINFRVNAVDRLYKLYKPKNPFKSSLLNAQVHRMQYLKLKAKNPDKIRKYKKFEHFINHTLNTTTAFKTYDQILKADLDFDVMIAGSDQIWNSALAGGVNPAYFLDFGRQDAKRISYAASIGRTNILPEERMQFLKYLKNFDYISVREEGARNEVRELTDKPVEVVVDPTILLPKEHYDRLKVDPKETRDYIYVHNVHLGRIDPHLNAMVEEMVRRTDLSVIQNRADYDYTNQIGCFAGGSPEEFIGMIANAKYVITNSFHATVFATIYHTNFITIPHFQNPARMQYLLESLGIGNHLIQDPNNIPEDLKELEIDYDKVEEKRAIMRQRSVQWLQAALDGEKTVHYKTIEKGGYFERKDPFTCYGCSACQDVCPTGAISMKPDEEGFVYPFIQEEQCNDCGKCQEVCIRGRKLELSCKDEEVVHVYGAAHKTEEGRNIGTDGGVFPELAKTVMAEDGFVAGVQYTDDFGVEYGIANDLEGCAKFYGMKFIAAVSGDTNPKVKELLDLGKTVLYTGTPCQIAGLKGYLGQEYEKLYTAEVCCTGVPSPMVAKKYREALIERYKAPIVDYQFMNNFRGWKTPYTTIEFETGEVFLEPYRRNDYNNAGIRGRSVRPSCFECEYTGDKRSTADLTLGSFKRVGTLCSELDREEGVSIVKVNTEKGEKLWEKIKDQFDYQELPFEDVLGQVSSGAGRFTLERSKLMMEMQTTEDILPALRKYNPLKKKKKKRK